MAIKTRIKPIDVTKNCLIACTSQRNSDFLWNGCVVAKVSYGSYANYSKQGIDPVFDGLRQRTDQYVHRCIRKHDEYLLKNLNYVHVFQINNTRKLLNQRVET